MDNFIRIDYNTIVNVSSIQSINRYSIESEDYRQWIDMYNSLLHDVSEQYIKENINDLENYDEDEFADILFKKFAPIVRKNITNEIGECPSPYTFIYKIVFDNGNEMDINEDAYNKLCNVIGIDMSDENWDGTI